MISSIRSCFALMATAACLCLSTSAQGAIIYSGAPLTENFDSLVGMAAHFSATAGVQNSVPGLTTWDGAKIAGTGTTNMNMTVDNGIANSGALYSYGAAGSAERALGALGSGSNTGAFGVEIQNNAANAIDSVTISYWMEQWRSSTSTQNRLTFAYGVSGSGPTSTDYLSNASMTPETALDAVAFAPVAANAATDGNDPNFRTLVTQTFNVSVPVGASLFVRWQDFNDMGNDAGIGVDDFTFRATLVPEPFGCAAILVGLGLIARSLVRRV